MPLTKFQIIVLQLLKKHRNPNSYVAGGIAIHRANTSIRQSNDIDFFHDTDEAVTTSAQIDLSRLSENGYRITILIDQPSFIRAVIAKNTDSLKLEWARDTAFRFFPVIEDELLGFRLHDVDLTVNKCLALANRNEVRDIVDIIELDKTVLALSSACWAACGKDPGFTPELLLDCMRRHSIIRPEQLAAESFTKKIALPDLKKRWLSLMHSAEAQIHIFPTEDIGCLYLNPDGRVVQSPHMETLTLKDKVRHFGSVGGSWPRIIQEGPL